MWLEIAYTTYDFGLTVFLKDLEHSKVLRKLSQVTKVALDTTQKKKNHVNQNTFERNFNAVI